MANAAGPERVGRPKLAASRDPVALGDDGLRKNLSCGGTTLMGVAYRKLLEDILWARLEPGRKLRMQQLKRQYGLGQSPLREALNRLSEAGLVLREDNRGFRVCPTSAEELDELTRTRCWVEEIALRESMRNGDRLWEERVVIAYHWLSRTRRSADDSSVQAALEWERRHHQFHAAMISACRAPKLVRFCEQLQDQGLRYRNLAAMKEYREQYENEEHEAIRDAVLGREADLAVRLLCAHYNATQRIVSEALRYATDGEAEASG